VIESSINGQFTAYGYAVVPGIIGSDEINHIGRHVEDLARNGAGTRRLLDLPWCSELARRLADEPRLGAEMPSTAHAVQCTLFVKALDKNWLVSLHQDLSIPVAERIESAECTGWSQKQGDHFVQPPVSVLEEIVALRVHLEDCDERNGALRVVPGSHRLRRLNTAQAHRAREFRGERFVPVPQGGVMVMRPLLLHASSKACVDLPRRVLHFVFGPRTLPGGLSWPSRERSRDPERAVI
jgi:ectoine hydroxylase-related dioxygenase (phytanoyl-CoA dioxygenase family)